MTLPVKPDYSTEQRYSARLLDVLIRAGLIIAMTMLCYRVFAPFLPLIVWALILAVMLYPLQRRIARRLGGRQGLAATVLVIAGLALIVGPATVLMSSLGDMVQRLAIDLRQNTFSIPAPYPGIENWPLVGKRVHATWLMAHSDLPAMIASMKLDLGALTRSALGFVAKIGVGLLLFLASFIIAGIIMAFGESGARVSHRIFDRVIGGGRGAMVAELVTTTIRAVALGVIGIALIQATLVGITLWIADIPWAAALTAIVMVLGVAQVPAGVALVPAMIHLWTDGNYSTGESIGYSIMLAISAMTDNVLKPLLLGRGAGAPMPVVLIGALGGFATSGIMGLFLGATLLALGYRLFMSWVEQDLDKLATPGPAAE